MTKARQLADAVLENKFEKAKTALQKLKWLQQRQGVLLDELEQNVKIREALAKLGLDVRQVLGLIPRGLITHMSNAKAARFNVDWTGAEPDDFVGAKLQDGSEVFFSRPIAPTTRDSRKLGNDPFAPSGTHRSTTHSNKVYDPVTKTFARRADRDRGLFKR